MGFLVHGGTKLAEVAGLILLACCSDVNLEPPLTRNGTAALTVSARDTATVSNQRELEQRITVAQGGGGGRDLGGSGIRGSLRHNPVTDHDPGGGGHRCGLGADG